jgi:hypothetical protein
MAMWIFPIILSIILINIAAGDCGGGDSMSAQSAKTHSKLLGKSIPNLGLESLEASDPSHQCILAQIRTANYSCRS